jgi:hypothetical protein
VLAAADQAAQVPRRIEAASVELCPDGSVRVIGGPATTEAVAERDLRELLDELLLVAGSVTPGLLRAARRRTATGIDALVREIETALIPVNRAAARRALSRLERETARAVERGGLLLPSEPAPPAEFSPAPPATAEFSPEPPAVDSLTPPPVASELLPTPVAVPVRARVLSEPNAVKPFVARDFVETLPEPSTPPSLAEFETRPETVMARASQRPPAKPESVPPATVPYPVAMTPFLGTTTTRREVTPQQPPPPVIAAAPSDEWNAESEPELMLDVPIHIEILDPSEGEEDVEIGREEQPEELTEPFYMDDEGGVVWSRGPSSSRDFNVEAMAEAPAIELDQSPAPLREAVAEGLARVVAEAEAERMAPVIVEAETETPARVVPAVTDVPSPVIAEAAEVSSPVVAEVADVSAPAVLEAAEIPVPVVVDVAEIPVPALVEEADIPVPAVIEVAESPVPDVVEVSAPPKGEFDDVEMAVLLPSATPPMVKVRKVVPDEASLLPLRPLPRPRPSDVDELMRHFALAPEADSDEHDVRSTLKQLAGLDPTAAPPDVGRR